MNSFPTGMDINRSNERFAPTPMTMPVRKASTATWHCPVPGCSKVFRHQSSRSRHVSNAHKKKAIGENKNCIDSTISSAPGVVPSAAPVQEQAERFGVRCRKIVAGATTISSSSSLQILAHFCFDEKKFYWEVVGDQKRQVVEISFRHIENCVLNRVDPAVDVLRFRVSTISSLKGDADMSNLNWWDRNLEHALSFDNGVIDTIIRRLPNCSFVMRVEIALIDSKDTNPNNLKEKVRSMLNYDKVHQQKPQQQQQQQASITPAMPSEVTSTYSAPMVTPSSEHVPALSHGGSSMNLGKRQPFDHGHEEVPAWNFMAPAKASRRNLWGGDYLHEDAEVGSSSFPGSTAAGDVTLTLEDPEESAETLQFLGGPVDTESWTAFPEDTFGNANVYGAEGILDIADDEVDSFTNYNCDMLTSIGDPVMDLSVP